MRSSPADDAAEPVLAAFRAVRHEFEVWGKSIVETLHLAPDLNASPFPVIHSMRWRVKDETHLADKLRRKREAGVLVTASNLFTEITDLVGVRVLLLSQHSFPEVHRCVTSRVENGDWTLGEEPVAYSWDPEATRSYGDLGLQVAVKESYYTSVHYLIRSPNPKSVVCAELQVRTLLEEVWGEIDHSVNYPSPIPDEGVRRQIGVLARLVSAGSRLADSIVLASRDARSRGNPVEASQ